jgi:putative sporulation protein YyaC
MRLPNFIKLSHADENAVSTLSTHLAAVFGSLSSYRPIVFCCIGTDRSTGDSLGPIVGTQLHKKNDGLFHVYGTLNNPVHAMNLSETLENIESAHRNPFVVAIDACLGQLTSIGFIQVADGPLKPGAGVNKELPPVGNIHITGIVNVSGFMEYFVLQNTRLSLVMNMAETIATALHHSVSVSMETAAANLTLRFD